jgi:hypothetical protein
LGTALAPEKYFLKLNNRVKFILDKGPDNSQGDSSTLEKGLKMIIENNSLCGEGVGFGVPALEYPGNIIFSTSAKIKNENGTLVKSFSMDGSHRKTWMHKFTINDRFYSTISNKLSHTYKRDEKYRKLIKGLMKFITILGLRISTQKTRSKGFVDMTYAISRDNLVISVNTSRILDKKFNKLLIFNEQSADFDLYRDDFTQLRKDNIGVWEETNCQEACLTNESAKITFCLIKLDGAKLYRGRELLQPRLDWAGFCYITASKVENRQYIIEIK